MHNPILGKRIVCGETDIVHLELPQLGLFQFIDYSWPCRACGGRHCSECYYDTDGETIIVWDCGRFTVK